MPDSSPSSQSDLSDWWQAGTTFVSKEADPVNIIGLSVCKPTGAVWMQTLLSDRLMKEGPEEGRKEENMTELSWG